jgi:hypothetical protein
MSALKELVDKVRRAVAGSETAPAPEAKPFEWEPAPVPGSAPVPEEAPPETAAPAPAAAAWKRPAAPASSVVGSTIPADVAEFATVYKGAGLQPPAHGYGVDRVGQMLGHRSLVGLDRSVKASAVLAALDAAGVALEDVVHDAVLRYKALVAFEAAKDLELHDVKPRNERRIHALKEEIAAFQERKNAEIEQRNRETSAAVQTIARLRQRTRAEEERYHKAIALFVEALPARVIPMTPREGAGVAAETATPRPPELKAVPPPATAAADATVPVRAGSAEAPKAEAAPKAPADAAPTEPRENPPAATSDKSDADKA